MKKIGIMGGTFNPIHNAHLMMAQAAYEQYELDEIWFMPSKNPPHKKQEEIVSGEHRSRMVQFALDGKEHFIFSDIELRRQGTTYTCETLQYCVENYPEETFYFIMGGDSLVHFESWYHPEVVAKLCTILAVARDGMSVGELTERCRQYSEQYDGNFFPVAMPQVSISSMAIRDCLSQNKSVVGYLPDKVWHYIELHGLYGAHWQRKKWKEKELIPYLEATLRPQRYLHTLGVAVTAANLAACHMKDKEDVKRAKQAGLLHDCAKYLTHAEMIDLCRQYGIVLSEVERENPVLIHGKLGAYLAYARYGAEEEICSAIAFHTTGKPKMTTLEKILYVADYIEPRRKMDCKPFLLSDIRKQCFKDLDRGLLMILTNTVNYLQQGNMPIDEMTLQTYEYYKKKGR